ncbi:hypothetical protein RUM43_009507 [Polyplax serrata]|uniref:Mitochondrial import inner membrane translocase subunit Tim21 n=1 Tax=Polyplax serrata TaxID=468196 RepID=A0AAN8NVJ5_POLSC
MLSLNSFARQRFFVAFEAKALLKYIKQTPCNGANICQINSCSVHNKYQQSYRRYSTENKKDEIVKSSSSTGSEVSTTLETVKETTKTVYYSGIIAFGLGLTGIIFYTILKELFSRNSANNIYSKALDRCLKNDKVLLSLGEPIKAFGEENARGRRHHTNHLFYAKDGVNYLRMKFFIKGSRKRATVHLEMKENDSRNFEYRYLFVQLDEYPYTTIVLEDNRVETPTALHTAKEETLALT